MYDNIILLLPGTEICGMIEVWFFGFKKALCGTAKSNKQ